MATAPRAQVLNDNGRASEKLGFLREKNINKQLAQLATARGATETAILLMLLFLALLFALCKNAKRIMGIKNLT